MSFAHVRFIQTEHTDLIASYRVETCDFSEGSNWESMGMLSIDKLKRTYNFQLSPLSVQKRIIPPDVYDLPEEQRKIVLKEKYSNYGWGAWTARIHHWANSFIKDQKFPSVYPEHFF